MKNLEALLVYVYAIVLLLFSTSVVIQSERSETNEDHFTNEWAARIHGGPQVAYTVAQERGYENLGQLLGIEDTYLLRKLDLSKRALNTGVLPTQDLNEDHRVEFADLQTRKIREKRDVALFLKTLTAMMTFNDSCTSQRFTDPLWPNEWYICDGRSNPSVLAIDLHIDGVWKAGITGKGVVVCIPDDGLEWNNTDILPNYDPKASYDFNDMDPDPFPRFTNPETNGHGTRCAGEVGMAANNSVCGVGVAFNAKIGGVRILDGRITDSTEAMAIGFKCDYIDIYSASWGPPDDGKSLDKPDRLTSEAMEKCIRKGRDGKGVIYMWASGNGGYHGDNCNCDGYINDIYAVPISGVDANGRFPVFGEMCSSVIATAYSGDVGKNQQIITTDLHNTCAHGHVGTSAAAPLVAGVVALMLEANGELTWRDVQHIITWTSDNSSLLNSAGWQLNGVGLSFNTRFGFGLVYAERAVATAMKWKTVPPAFKCEVLPKDLSQQTLTSNGNAKLTFEATKCAGCVDKESVNYMEHVQIGLNVTYSRRGALGATLESPMGTISTILLPRTKDNVKEGFNNWVFMTREMWGESPSGTWTLTVMDQTNEDNSGFVTGAYLRIHGTLQRPKHMDGNPAKNLNC